VVYVSDGSGSAVDESGDATTGTVIATLTDAPQMTVGIDPVDRHVFFAGHDGTDAVLTTVTLPAPPRVTVPSDIQTDGGPEGTPVTFDASAIESFQPFDPVPTSCTPASGSLFSPGNTTVICSADDLIAGTGSASFTVTVVNPTLHVVPATNNQTAVV